MKYILSSILDNFPTWEHEEMASNSELLSLGLASILTGIVIVSLAILFISYLYKKRGLITPKLSKLFVFVWFLGFCVYDVGMYTGEPWSLIGNSFMAIIHAFGMFIFESDASAIHAHFHNNTAYMTCFSLVHLVAACISLMFVITHFVNLIKSKLKMYFSANQAAENTYIFWGISSASHFLAKSIRKSKDCSSKDRIVFVRTNDENKSTSFIEKIEQYFFSQPKSDEDTTLYDIRGCLTTSSYVDLRQITREELGDSPDILGYVLNLKLLKRIIKPERCGKLHIFFLSDDEKDNIHSVEIFRMDRNIKAFANNGDSVKIYCHARYNSVHRVMEDEGLDSNIEIKIVDSSRISVNEIKQNIEMQPVNFVDIQNDATVSSSFNSMVIGFGEVGLDMVRFLYEFGAFVSNKSDNNKVIRSDFQCDVIDSNMTTLVGTFAASAPEIKTNQPIVDNDTTSGDPLINLHKMDCRSIDFYKLLKQKIENLNYIVICTYDDELNISMAVRVLRYALRYRKDLNKFHILVRIKNDVDDHYHGIMYHYNRLLAAERSAKEIVQKELIHQDSISTSKQILTPISLFGLEKDTYTYDNIISDKLIKKAVVYKSRYDLAINAMKHREGMKENDEYKWEDEYRDLMQLNGDYKGCSPTYTGINRLRRIQSQNIANCLHIHTKQILAQVALGSNKYAEISEHKFIRKENEIEYHNVDGTKVDNSFQKVFDVLAQTEHLRWNAAHCILGYINAGEVGYRNEAKFEHGSLKPWQNLDPFTRSFDYNVVDVSLGIVD